MRPIDAIRGKIDNDLFKYQPFSVCRITKVVDIKGMGLVMQVAPFVSDDDNTEKVEFNVICGNRPMRWWDLHLKEKFYALVLNIPQDNSPSSIGFLIPQTFINSFDEWDRDDMDDIKAQQIELIDEKLGA